MRVYILIVTDTAILERCELFYTLHDAWYEGKLLCNEFGISVNENYFQFYPKMNGWIIGEDQFKFICVVERNLALEIPADETTADSFLDELDIPIFVDDERDGSLPGGFSYPDNKPLLMKDIIDDRKSFRLMHEMSDYQKTALVVARIRKRPNFSCTLPNGVILSQIASLNEIKLKTALGDFVIEQECEAISRIYYEVF